MPARVTDENESRGVKRVWVVRAEFVIEGGLRLFE